jgi:hypothetical protein
VAGRARVLVDVAGLADLVEAVGAGHALPVLLKGAEQPMLKTQSREVRKAQDMRAAWDGGSLFSTPPACLSESGPVASFLYSAHHMKGKQQQIQHLGAGMCTFVQLGWGRVSTPWPHAVVRREGWGAEGAEGAHPSMSLV